MHDYQKALEEYCNLQRENYEACKYRSNDMQKVEIYYDMDKAKSEMEKHIKYGWKIHTLSLGAHLYGEKILVVYEKESTY